MAMNNPYQKYRENAVNTASPEELTLMLYDGAIKFCNQAIMAIENKNIEDANNLIIKVQLIVREFQVSLDKKYKVSESFATMYDYIYRQLVEANVKKDVEILKEVNGYLKEFRDTWKAAMKLSKNPSA